MPLKKSAFPAAPPKNSTRRDTSMTTVVVSALPACRIMILNSLERIFCYPRAFSSSDALLAVSDPNVAVVLIDCNGMTSPPLTLLFQLARLRSDLEHKLPKVLLIPDIDNAISPSLLSTTVDVIIHKPYTPDILQTAVDRLYHDASLIPANDDRKSILHPLKSS